MFFDFLELNKNYQKKYTGPNAKGEVFPVGRIDDFNILYAPFLGRVYVYEDDSSKLVQQHINFENNSISREGVSDTNPAPHEISNLCILPTLDCNLGCSYCHSDSGKIRKTIDFEFVKAAMDLISTKTDKPLLICFHGGGEPTLAFEIMKKTREYAKRFRNEITFALQTNGVFSEEVRNWVSKNIDEIHISCDGPPSIQDIQRPLKNGGKSSPIIEKNIRYFLNSSAVKDLSLTTVISKFSVDKQVDILDYFYRLGVKKVKFTTVIKTGRALYCPTIYSTAPDPKSFLDNLLKTIELADVCGIELKTPNTVSFEWNTNRVCGFSYGEFILTADGFVTPCLCASSNASDHRQLLYGHFDEAEKKIKIDKKKLDFLQNRVVQNIPTCQSCFMKWNCAGGCAIDGCLARGRDIYSPHAEYCNQNRTQGREFLLYKIQKDLIKIKPFLEERSDGMVYRGIFNTFQLAKLSNKEPESGVMLQLDVNKVDLVSLTKEIVRTNPKLLLISFKLSRRNLSLNLGKKIEKFLRTLKSKHIPFIITKPLPRCLFDQKYEEVVKEFRIPKNCEECLELFALKGDSFRICKTDEKILQKEVKNRKQIYNSFRKSNRRVHAAPCGECVYRLRRKCNGLCL
ncbi:radical SAM protein [Candidatus Micrarchaeota archaeon]|nr:radical SAM protein [Candidatus Micrarchaeota archaeon]